MVHENCCQARYRTSRAAKDTPLYIYLNRAECRSLAGGHHDVLRGSQRAETGIYEGIYGPASKLTATKSGTRTTLKIISRLASESRTSGRAQAVSIGGLLSDVSPFSIPDAENLITAKIDQKVEVSNPGSSGDQNAILLRLMSSLCSKIEKLDSGIEKGNTAIIHALSKTRPSSQPIILHPPFYKTTTPATEDSAGSSVARRYAKAVRQKEQEMDPEKLDYEEEHKDEEMIDNEGEYEEEWSDYDEWGTSDRRVPSKKGSCPRKKKNTTSS